MSDPEAELSNRERRCIWCGLPKFGEGRCVCDDPKFELQEQCATCGAWEDVDHIHTDTRDGEEVGICPGCVVS